MHKKLLTVCFAALALGAIALPAIAQATNSPVVTHPTGTVLASGTKIEATNIGETLMRNTETGAIQLACTTATMTGTLTKNETGNVQGEISSASFTGTGSEGRCTGFVSVKVVPLNFPWCLKSNNTMLTDEFTVTGAGCGSAAKTLEFQLLPSTGGTCTYRATKASIKGTYTTHAAGDAKMRIPRSGLSTNEEKSTETGFTKVHDSTFFSVCPSSSYLEMEFTLETDGVVNSGLFISS